jgi:hypothetical protein
MWKASAVRASEWARMPATSSRRKKAVSMIIITLMRVLLDHAILEEPAMANASVGRFRTSFGGQGRQRVFAATSDERYKRRRAEATFI